MIEITHFPDGNPLGVKAVYTNAGEAPITVVADSEEAALEEIDRELERIAAG